MQYKAISHRLTASEISAGKVKLCILKLETCQIFTTSRRDVNCGEKIELQCTATKIENAFVFTLLIYGIKSIIFISQILRYASLIKATYLLVMCWSQYRPNVSNKKKKDRNLVSCTRKWLIFGIHKE